MSEQLHTRAAWWALILLTATYTFSFIDRQIINLLVDPIRTDLSLSDSQVSFLQGLAFVLPYVILSIPLGRIVDRANRRLPRFWRRTPKTGFWRVAVTADSPPKPSGTMR